MAIHLTTLGGLRVLRDGAELDRLPGQRLRAALLVYMAVEQCAARDTLIAMFWPESSGANARHALRQSLYHVRRELELEWLQLRTQDVCVSDDIHVDVHDLDAALEAGEPERAARLYAGPFLAGVHLADLTSWESWVDAQRAHCARAFRRACREWVDARRAAGDVHGAVDAAQHWLAPDPFDDEAQHALIAAFADAGERTAAIRQYETYARLLEAESLTPLDATAALIQRVRSDAKRTPSEPHEPVAARQEPAPPPLEAPTVSDEGAPPPHEPEPPAAAPRRTRRYTVMAAASLVLLVLAAWAVDRLRAAGDLAQSDIAVMPFSVRGNGDAQYLADGVVNLLSTALDGATVRPVDARATFAVLAQEGARGSALARGRRVASRLGAGLYVAGDVVHAGGRLQIEAGVYRTGGSARPLARAAVAGEPEQVFDLIDALAAGLLAQLNATPQDALTLTAARTTTSLPAFKAYLEGEAAMRAGRFERAADAFTRAVALDTTYAVAYYRLALARDWGALGHERDAAIAAARYAARLAPRERALLEALQAYHTGDAPEAERRYRAILSRYPDDVEAWAQLGEALFHNGPRYGRPPADAGAAWRTVLAYEPYNLWAAVHLARIAAVQRDVATLDTLLARFTAHEIAADRRLVQVALLRALAARDAAAALRLARAARGWEDAAVYQLAGYLTAYSDDPVGTRAIVRALMDPHRGAGMRADMYWFTTLLHAAAGEPAAMWAAFDSAAALARGVPSEWHGRMFVLVNEWWLATLPLPHADTLLARVRAAAMTVRLPPPAHGERADPTVGDEIWFSLAREAFGAPGRLEALRQYVVGLLSLRLDDRAGADAALSALARMTAGGDADWFVRDSERALRAFSARYDGRAGDALRALDALEYGPIGIAETNIAPFVARAHERYLRAELLAELGRDAEAAHWYASLAALSVPETAYRGLRE